MANVYFALVCAGFIVNLANSQPTNQSTSSFPTTPGFSLSSVPGQPTTTSNIPYLNNATTAVATSVGTFYTESPGTGVSQAPVIPGSLGSLFSVIANMTKGSLVQNTGCFTKKFPNNNVPSVMANALNNELDRCASQVDQQQVEDFANSAANVFQSLTGKGGTNILGELIKSAQIPCEKEASRTFCLMLKQTQGNRNCQICNLLAMLGRNVEIESCACEQQGPTTVLFQNLMNRMQKCVSDLVQSGAARTKYGSLVPDC